MTDSEIFQEINSSYIHSLAERQLIQYEVPGLIKILIPYTLRVTRCDHHQAVEWIIARLIATPFLPTSYNLPYSAIVSNFNGGQPNHVELADLGEQHLVTANAAKNLCYRLGGEGDFCGIRQYRLRNATSKLPVT